MQADATIDSERKRKRKKIIYLLVGIAVFIWILIPMAALTGLWVTERAKRAQEPPRVTVPNVVGQDWRRGEELLREKGLQMRVLAARNDQNQPHGVIIDQSPMPGESVEVSHTVGVSVGGRPGEFGTGAR